MQCLHALQFLKTTWLRPDCLSHNPVQLSAFTWQLLRRHEPHVWLSSGFGQCGQRVAFQAARASRISFCPQIFLPFLSPYLEMFTSLWLHSAGGRLHMSHLNSIRACLWILLNKAIVSKACSRGYTHAHTRTHTGYIVSTEHNFFFSKILNVVRVLSLSF